MNDYIKTTPPMKPGSRLITHGDPEWAMFYRPASPVTDIATQVRPHIQSMRRIMESSRGVALCAQQVGIPLRFFIFGGKHCGTSYIRCVVNPVIVLRSAETEVCKEGCLSLPGVTSDVVRSVSISATWSDVLGNQVGEELDGLGARIFQHACDILGGQIFASKEDKK